MHATYKTKINLIHDLPDLFGKSSSSFNSDSEVSHKIMFEAYFSIVWKIND